MGTRLLVNSTLFRICFKQLPSVLTVSHLRVILSVSLFHGDILVKENLQCITNH